MSDPPSQGADKGNKANEVKKEKLGHRRVDDEGTVTYKKNTTSDIQRAIQLGVNLSVGSVNNKPKRDLLLKDFGVEEVIAIPKNGTATTPAHSLNDFQFRTFAPLAFRRFREIFEVDMLAFMNSICSKELKVLSNPGASGSIFYLTKDDEFIIKTVQKKEAKFLQKLLPEYFMNLMQHPRTLLPKYFGLFSYETMGKNIRFVIMNNLLPSIPLNEKYDLKGSSFKRYASSKEKAKPSPTLKDLDFKEKHPSGLILDAETYDALMSTIQRDCTVLESFRIMDYSLLLAIVKVDQYRQTTTFIGGATASNTNNGLEITKFSNSSKRESCPSDFIGSSDAATAAASNCIVTFSDEQQTIIEDDCNNPVVAAPNINNASANCDYKDGDQPGDSELANRSHVTRGSSHGRSVKRIAAFSTPIESIRPTGTAVTEDKDYDELPQGGIPARSESGEKLYLYLGIIDILQSYQINKRVEHSIKSIIYDGEKISVTRPSFYRSRFEDMFSNTVFKKSTTDNSKFKKAGKLVRMMLALRPKRKLSRHQETDAAGVHQHQRSKSEIHTSSEMQDIVALANKTKQNETVNTSNSDLKQSKYRVNYANIPTNDRVENSIPYQPIYIDRKQSAKRLPHQKKKAVNKTGTVFYNVNLIKTNNNNNPKSDDVENLVTVRDPPKLKRSGSSISDHVNYL